MANEFLGQMGAEDHFDTEHHGHKEDTLRKCLLLKKNLTSGPETGRPAVSG